MLSRLEAFLDRLVFAVVGLLMTAMVALVVLAVVMRYGAGAPLIYSYDLSVLLFAWVVFGGLALAEREGAHLAVPILDEVLPERAAWALAVIRKAALIALSLTVAWIGWKLTQRGVMTIPSLRISMAWLYASLPAGFFLLALAQTLGLLRLLSDGRVVDRRAAR